MMYNAIKAFLSRAHLCNSTNLCLAFGRFGYDFQICSTLGTKDTSRQQAGYQVGYQVSTMVRHLFGVQGGIASLGPNGSLGTDGCEGRTISTCDLVKDLFCPEFFLYGLVC